jgi:hypothetical protein
MDSIPHDVKIVAGQTCTIVVTTVEEAIMPSEANDPPSAE